MKVILLICVKFLFFASVRGSPCPAQCQCQSTWVRGVTNVIVGCAKKKLTSIPTSRIPRFMTSLALNENFITELPANVFKRYRHLRELYLYKNFITHIHKDAFRGLHRLRVLSIHSNQIRRIENGTFRDLRNLRKLYLFTNFIEDINPVTFIGMKKMETIFLHENLLRVIPKGTFLPLERLKVLTLYRNYLGVLHSGSFNGLNSTRELYLYENKISKIEKNAFKGTPQLKVLHLGNNYLNVLTYDSFVGLNDLLELNLDNNHIQTLNANMFRSIPKVRKLVFLGNRIANVRPGTFQNLKRLHLLSVSRNNLTHLRPGMFAGLVELRRLFLQNNQIEWIDPFSFGGLINLQSLYLFRNRIYYIQEKSFYGLFSLSELNLGVNNITGLAHNAFLGLPRLVSLQLNSNNLRMLPAGAFSKLRNLYRLVIYFNKIAYIHKYAFSGLSRLRHVVWYPPLALVRSSKILRSLQSNNLHCDCNVKHMKRWLKKQKIHSTIFCARPSYLHRSNITTLRDQYLKCADIAVKIYPKYVMAEKYSDVYMKCITNIAANFSWVLNGKMLKSSYKFFQMTSGILLLRSVSASSSGQYTCIAKSETGISAVSAFVKIGIKPKITDTSGAVMFIKKYEETLVITCATSGFPEPFIIWYKNGKRVKKNNPYVFVGFNQSLVILKATKRDAGKYQCKARNQLGLDEKTIDVVVVHELSPCQPICDVGSSCVRRFECMAANQTRKPCTNFKPPTKTVTNEPEDIDSSGDGSGDDKLNVISDDEGEDDGENSIDGVGTGKPTQVEIKPTLHPQVQQIKPLEVPIPTFK